MGIYECLFHDVFLSCVRDLLIGKMCSFIKLSADQLKENIFGVVCSLS